MREVIMTGKTVEEATELALSQLGVSAEDENVSVEVVELPQKKLFRSIPAKVRVCVEEEEAAAPEKAAPAAPKAPAADPRPAPEAPKAAPALEKPAPAPEAQQPKPVPMDPEVPFDLSTSPKAMAAAEYLRDVAAHMGAGELDITAVRQGETIILKAQGDHASALIGHRGEVMESLSYLCSLCANRLEGDYAKIGVDINNYRAKREANLVQLAKRIGAKVARTGRSHMLEPMNPYERRIIHSAVAEVPGVKSESTGEGAARRVVIMSTQPGARNGASRPDGRRGGDRSEGRPGGGRGPRGPRPDGDRRDDRRGDRRDRGPKSNVPAREYADKPRDPGAAPVAVRRSETINDAAGLDLPLYGKIEL